MHGLAFHFNPNPMHPMLDAVSFKFLGITLLGAWFTNLTKADGAMIMTGLAASTTVVYNLVRLIKEIKNRKSL